MKQFPHIISKLFYEPLVITPQRHAALCQLLEAKLAGHSPVVMEDDDDRREQESALQLLGSTAIIPVHGTLVRYPEDIAMSECGCSMQDLEQMHDNAEHDPRVSRIIYDFRTPGGDVTGIPEMGRKIAASRKETVAFTASQCCSGGIWLAAQCKQFYATESARVGSVGVYTMMMDYTKMLEKEGVGVSAISAGKYKLLGAYWKPLGDEERAILQKRVDKIYSQFKAAMETHRVVKDENFGNGLVFDGEEAADIGFIDGLVEGIEDVLEM
jgi:signal peptide peptidase SppA